MADISSLPREIQGIILTHYMGNSFARYSYMKSVFAGDNYMELSNLVDSSFSPTVHELYIRDTVVEELHLESNDHIQSINISAIIRVAGRYSGLVKQIEFICSDALNWQRGRLRISRRTLGWYTVVSFEPVGNVWVFA